MVTLPPMKDRRAGEAVIPKDPSMLWFIHGEAYDLSTFIHSHPGGYLIRRGGGYPDEERHVLLMEHIRLFIDLSGKEPAHRRSLDLPPILVVLPVVGGYDAIMLGRGRDCTSLFESYHPFTDRPAAILPKFKVRSRTPQRNDMDYDYYDDHGDGGGENSLVETVGEVAAPAVLVLLHRLFST